MKNKNKVEIISNGTGEDKNKIRFTPKTLPEKQFVTRNSLLTDLFTNPHIQTVYNMFIATFLGLLLYTFVHDYITKGEINLGLRLIVFGFQRVHVSIFSWLGLFGGACFSFTCFNFWAKRRITLKPKSKSIKLWDFSAVALLLIYYIVSFVISARLVRHFELPPASSAIVIFEQVRFIMKIHSFIRSTTPKMLNYKIHSEQQLQLPKFSKFLYFLFAPTLIYKDEYPRTKEIRWYFVSSRALEVVGVIFYYSFLLEGFLLPLYQDFGLRKYTINEVILSSFKNTITGILFLLSSFYMIFHSWLNLFAELLRFGDRQFYQDWWTSTSLLDFFRKWNVFVYNWLYTYIYKDMYEFVVPLNKTVAKFAVFFVSAVVHEWVLTYFLGFFFPLLFFLFTTFGTLLIFINPQKTAIMNILLLSITAFTAGNTVGLYTIEYYARTNAPILNPTFFENLQPRLLTCDCFV